MDPWYCCYGIRYSGTIVDPCSNPIPLQVSSQTRGWCRSRTRRFPTRPSRSWWTCRETPPRGRPPTSTTTPSPNRRTDPRGTVAWFDWKLTYWFSLALTELTDSLDDSHWLCTNGLQQKGEENMYPNHPPCSFNMITPLENIQRYTQQAVSGGLQQQQPQQQQQVAFKTGIVWQEVAHDLSPRECAKWIDHFLRATWTIQMRGRECLFITFFGTSPAIVCRWILY